MSATAAAQVRSKRGQRLVRGLDAGSSVDGRSFLDRHRGLLRPALVSKLSQLAWAHVRIDTAEALALAETAIRVAEAIQDKAALALALRTKANACYMLGKHEESVALHARALELFEAAGDENEIARTISASLQPLLLLGEYDKAFAAADRARAIFTEHKNEWRLARLDINVGNIYYRQDRFAEALACYQRAYKTVLDQNDAEGIGVVLGNLATCFISVGDFAQALETNQQACDYCEKHGMPLLRAQAEYNIAYVYFLRGEYSRAIDLLRSTRLACEKAGDHYHHALCNLDLSELYLELNLSAEAGELARQANAEFKTLSMGYEDAKSLAFEAISMSQQGQAFQSVKTFQQSREIFVQEKNQVWPSLIDLYQALVLFNEGRHFEAKRLAKSALDFFDSSALPGKAVLCRLLLARIAQRTGDLRIAQRDCAAGLDRLKDHQTPTLKHQAYLLMGQIHLALKEQQAAYACFRESRAALEMLRGNLRGQELKLAFLKNRLEVYELLVDACLQAPSPASLQEAFSYIEEAKSRTLMDQMLQAPGESDAQGQSDLVRRMRGLRDELNWYYSLIEMEQLRPEQRSSEHMQRLQSQVKARESDLVRVLQESSGAEAVQAGVRAAENVSIEQIREAFSPKTMVLEYFQTGDRILVSLLGRDSLEIVPVTLASRVTNLLRLLQFQLAKFRLGTEYTSAFHQSLLESTKSHLRNLHDELLGPIREGLEADHLLIVPHGPLHYVPFHALLKDDCYVIDDFTVSYAPSASIYSVCANKKVNTSGGALLMGVPDDKAPLIRDEIQSLVSILPDSIPYLGNAASDYILRSEGPNSRFIHIATHGYFRQDSPMFSSIRLGNSYLSLYDLYQLRLPVELITLSGCATGLNVVAAGDELIGLARGLFQAGAQSLLLSLWDVHDASTAEFMRAFYTQLQQGSDKAQAVRTAMIEVRSRHPHPYQWAPFVLMGSSR